MTGNDQKQLRLFFWVSFSVFRGSRQFQLSDKSWWATESTNTFHRPNQQTPSLVPYFLYIGHFYLNQWFVTRCSDSTNSQSFWFLASSRPSQKNVFWLSFSLRLYVGEIWWLRLNTTKKIFVTVELEFNQNRRLQIRMKSKKMSYSRIFILHGRFGIFLGLLPSFW